MKRLAEQLVNPLAGKPDSLSDGGLGDTFGNCAPHGSDCAQPGCGNPVVGASFLGAPFLHERLRYFKGQFLPAVHLASSLSSVKAILTEASSGVKGFLTSHFRTGVRP